MKEKWMTPKTVIEEFTPNEYIAVCWGVGCNTALANAYEESHNNSAQTHSNDYCGRQSHQYLVENQNGALVRMEEIDTDGQGTLPCTIYTGIDYGTPLAESEYKNIKHGQTLYWTTQAKDGRVWHHQGTVASAHAS